VAFPPYSAQSSTISVYEYYSALLGSPQIPNFTGSTTGPLSASVISSCTFAPQIAFSVNPAYVTFQYAQGTLPASFTLPFTPVSTGANLTFSASSSVPWLTVPAKGAANNPYSGALNLAGLAPGTYQGIVTFTSSGGQTDQSVVNVTVLSEPVLSSPSNSVALIGVFGSSVPSPLDIPLTSSGANIPFVATSNTPWLSFTASGTNTPAILHIQADPTGLAEGIYYGTITVNSAQAGNSPYAIQVKFYVVGNGIVY
jgi:hypothetical protein